MKRKRAGTDASPADGDEQVPAATGRSSNLVPAVIIAVGLLGGGFFVGGRSPAPAEAAAPPAHAKAEAAEAATDGPVQSIEPITLNLADGRFLKVGLALQLAAVEGGGHGGGEELAPAKALDLAISLLGAHTMEELASPQQRELVKKQLSEQVAKAYVDHETHEPLVTKIYFTEFVMQ